MLYLASMSLWSLFAVGFVLGLTGAMAPGPLLTVTISESTKRGGHVGPLVVLGHGILEIILLLVIVFGLGGILANRTLYTVFSFFGGIVMIWMSIGIMKGLPTYTLNAGEQASGKGLHPIVAGIIVSLSNPYWFIWWLTIGMGYLLFAKGLGWPGILAFFIGHISSDLAWYSFVSYGIHMGRRYVRTRVIKTVLFICSLFLVFFGLFFIFKGYQFLNQG
jgi:threonine/homoserine/homoserine lactone efflux protein